MYLLWKCNQFLSPKSKHIIQLNYLLHTAMYSPEVLAINSENRLLKMLKISSLVTNNSVEDRIMLSNSFIVSPSAFAKLL